MATVRQINAGLVEIDGIPIDISNKIADEPGDFHFNVKTYGAVGDGVTDDTTAIQAAIDAANAMGGGTVVFPLGDYLVSSTLTVGNSTTLKALTPTHWQNDGDVTKIFVASSFDGPVIENKDTTDGNLNITLDGLAIHGSTSAGGGSGYIVSISSTGTLCRGLRIRDCNFRYGVTGAIYLSNIVEGWVQDCFFLDSDGYGIRGNGASDFDIVGNYITTKTGGNADENIYLSGGAYNRIRGNYLFYGDRGIRTANKGDIIVNNTIRLSWLEGILISGASDSCINHVVANNYIFDTNQSGGGTLAGILFDSNTHDNVCVGNRIANDEETDINNGIRLASTAYNNLITNNICTDVNADGISDTSTGQNYIFGNIADNRPIHLEGSGTPEGEVTARIGSSYYRTDGGANTTLYIKESGTGNTGWVAK